jgi:hypothetical protein
MILTWRILGIADAVIPKGAGRIRDVGKLLEDLKTSRGPILDLQRTS